VKQITGGGGHIIVTDLIIVPIGRMGQVGPYNCPRGLLTNIIVPGELMGPAGR